VALATAYTDVVTERLKLFLQEHGFVVTATKGLGYDRIPDNATIGQDVLFKLGVDSYAMSQKADALVVSCGALKTLDLIVPLEKQITVPVVSSTPHGLMNAVRLVGVSPRVKGFGKAFEKA
jgi:arylmalonate decarboxylase